MKHIFRILFLVVSLVWGIMTVSAQSAQVLVVQKVPSLPATATNYLDDPFRYFNIQVILNGVGSEGLDVFFDVDFSHDNSDFYLRTKAGTVPPQPIHLSEGINIIRKDAMLDQLRGGRKDTNFDYSKPLAAQLLPEGNYQLCLDVYRWTDKDNPSREPISDGNCPSYDICYSGSAPELVSPMAGAQMALNGAMVVIPARKINFLWTPVISNCARKDARFRYQLKVVKVLSGQNYNDAIKYNPTVFSAEVRNNNFVLFDTLRDIKVQMERGALYVAQVQAEQIKDSRSLDDFIIANDGKSQPMPFFWDDYDASKNYVFDVDDEEIEGDDSEGEEGVTVWDGGVEEVSELETIIDEMEEPAIVLVPNRHYVESDGYFTIPTTKDLEVACKPAQHNKLKDVSNTIKLYNYTEGGVDEITEAEPLFSKEIENQSKKYTLDGWGADLKQGSLYYLEVSSSFTVGYWNYSIADTSFYVNDILAQHVHDTISREFKEEALVQSDGVFFQWGDDPESPEYTTPQWKAPVDRSGDDIYDPMSYKLPAPVPEIVKPFPVSWTAVKDVVQGDKVEYEVNVYELKSGQTPEEAVSENKVLVSRTLTNVHAISGTDTDFFKVFSTNKTYVMTLSTDVDSENNGYHFKNGNEAIPVIFKIVK